MGGRGDELPAMTADEILDHEFRLAVRGYAVAEVDELLGRLAGQVAATQREIAELRRRLERAERRDQA